MTTTMVQRLTFRASLVATTVKRLTGNWWRRRDRFAAALLLAGVAASLSAVPAHAQFRTPPGTNERALENAQERLKTNGSDVSALRDAIRAAMRLGNLDTAATYARRAQQLAPNDPIIVAANGAIEIHRARPREGLALFSMADKLGAPLDAFAADRALGYDLIGDQPSAQFYYARAHRSAPDDEVLRRYALSLSISGEYETGEAMLKPLLHVQDAAAWRMQAFMLAINGRPAEAREVLGRILPSDLAGSIGPYMDVLPNLSRAQQAAAAHLGLFPSVLPPMSANRAVQAERAPRRRIGAGWLDDGDD